MKTILIPLLLFAALSANAQTDTAGIKFIEPPDSTGFGIPDGKLISKEIGVSGGTIVSEDGRVELIFPEGALTTNTTITIQPTTNLAPNGAGKSYQFEPSGTQFKKPVGIIIHYSDEEAEECPPDLMGMAMQDHTGKWSFIEYEEWDSLGKVLKGFIGHFSGLSNVYKLRLRVEETVIKVNSGTLIKIVDISRRWDSSSSGGVSSLTGEYRYGQIDINAPVLWYVNGIQNGNRSVGSIEADNNPTYQGNARHIHGIFTAPEFLPKNPANVKVDIYVFSGRKMVFYRAVSLKCKINIYDEYKITISAKGGFDLFCDAKIKDESSFGLRIFPNKKPEFHEIDNKPPVLTKQASCGNEGDLNYDVTGCVGPVNIRESLLMGYGMSYSTNNDPPEYTIEFSTAFVKIAKANGKLYGDKISKTENYMDATINVGNKIKFKLDRQHKSYITPEEGCDCEVSITIDPI